MTSIKMLQTLKQESKHKNKERKLQQRRLYLLLLILFFTFHVSCSHHIPLAVPLVVAASKRRRPNDVTTSTSIEMYRSTPIHVISEGTIVDNNSRARVVISGAHQEDRNNHKKSQKFRASFFHTTQSNNNKNNKTKVSKSSSFLNSLSSKLSSDSHVDHTPTRTRGVNNRGKDKNNDSMTIRIKRFTNDNKRQGNDKDHNNNNNNNIYNNKKVKDGVVDVYIDGHDGPFNAIMNINNLVCCRLRENVHTSKIIDFGYNTVRPVVGAFLLRLRQHLTLQGRGFGLICVGLQQIASMSRTKHINVALRLKRMEEEAQENKYGVPEPDMEEALRQGLLYQYGKNEAILKKEGWKNVHSEKHFSLFKRRTSGTKKGPVTYLMMGEINDVTPRAFLRAQIIKSHRDKWDKTMAAMESIKTSTIPMENGAEKSQDILYYRTRWPWPLKDRDYTLARRCKIVTDKRAIVFVSKSVNHPKALVDGALRVDKYWCHSTFFATVDGSNKKGGTGRLGGSKMMFDTPGLSYVTMFCDDTNVALPTSVIDLLSRHAEKTVPSSMKVLFDYSKNLK